MPYAFSPEVPEVASAEFLAKTRMVDDTVLAEARANTVASNVHAIKTGLKVQDVSCILTFGESACSSSKRTCTIIPGREVSVMEINASSDKSTNRRHFIHTHLPQANLA